MSKKPIIYESIDRKAEESAVSLVAVTIAGVKYVVAYEVGKYIESLQADRDKFVRFREMTSEEMAAFVNERTRAIIDTLNANYLKYNPTNTLYLSEKIDAEDFKTMDALCDLFERVIYDKANVAAGTDPHADGLTEEV